MRCCYLELGISLHVVARYISYLYSLSCPSRAKTRESSARAMVAMLCSLNTLYASRIIQRFFSSKEDLSHLAVTNVSNYRYLFTQWRLNGILYQCINAPHFKDHALRFTLKTVIAFKVVYGSEGVNLEEFFYLCIISET